MAYDVNDAEKVVFTYSDSGGTLADPTAVTATVTQPDGTATTYTYGSNAELVRDSAGLYHIDVTFTTAGTWTVEGHGTGAVTAAATQSFIVGVTHAYCSVEEFSDYLGSTASASAGQLRRAVNSASRRIDSDCGRQFWLEPTAIPRTYVPEDLYCVEVADIGNTTGLAIATDATGDGVYETVWAASDYQLLPVNAPLDGPEAKPWTAIKAVGTHTFPWIGGAYLRRIDRVQVTARWGWPAVPEAITEACLIKAAQLFHRKNSPQGVIAFDEFGAVRVGRGEDKDYASLISEYRLDPILIA